MQDVLNTCPGTPKPADEAGGVAASRPLVRSEFNIVLEDLKHAGVAPKVLKSLLPALWKGLADGTPLEQWGLDDAQAAAYGLLQDHLEALGASLHPPRCVPTPAGGRQAPAVSAPVVHIKWRSPFDEFTGTARIVAGLLARNPDLAPCDVCIVAPNTMWAHLIKTELERRRVPVQTVLDTDVIAGDPRVRARLGTLEAYAFTALAASPNDPAAWRFWLALGEPDFACASWRSLVGFAHERGLGVREALAELDACATAPFDGAPRLAERAQDAEGLLARARGKQGFALRNLLCRTFPSPQVKELLEFFEGTEDAGALFAGLQRRSFAPSFADRPSQVRLGTYQTAQGLHVRHIVLPGLVEGVVPALATAGTAPDEAEAARAAQQRAFVQMLASASESIYISGFQHVGVEQAPQLRLTARRTRNLKGANVAVFTQSPFIDEMGDALPGSVSGEQFFAGDQGGVQ